MTKEEKIPFTKNTKEARQALESLGFRPLSFFQGKEFICGLISTIANARESWKEKDYSTFDIKEDYHEDNPCDLETFIKKIKTYEN
ncbi:hypothetical protein C1637_09830 [Chryseobacterium lactis]|uniref:Uncharacterized protein n=1 Tax=Chryseobacterium lactis TaxID=1241981 RepID=A0A3G6RBZ0_CHRLC|nr:hypothetical protein [Chryseobacterium lactis]AZA82190.1 hypothetical protein EG342_09870 [Chryseobacterium lactis]AZB02571.1 hypothetical protein EG341_00725 [Chryseobacterium lactis]PNW14134.1 hypothetical protein C1637_09830 [Chryseobacterium lactis]